MVPACRERSAEKNGWVRKSRGSCKCSSDADPPDLNVLRKSDSLRTVTFGRQHRQCLRGSVRSSPPLLLSFCADRALNSLDEKQTLVPAFSSGLCDRDEANLLKLALELGVLALGVPPLVCRRIGSRQLEDEDEVWVRVVAVLSDARLVIVGLWRCRQRLALLFAAAVHCQAWHSAICRLALGLCRFLRIQTRDVGRAAAGAAAAAGDVGSAALDGDGGGADLLLRDRRMALLRIHWLVLCYLWHIAPAVLSPRDGHRRLLRSEGRRVGRA